MKQGMAMILHRLVEERFGPSRKPPRLEAAFGLLQQLQLNHREIYFSRLPAEC